MNNGNIKQATENMTNHMGKKIYCTCYALLYTSHIIHTSQANVSFLPSTLSACLLRFHAAGSSFTPPGGGDLNTREVGSLGFLTAMHREFDAQGIGRWSYSAAHPKWRKWLGSVASAGFALSASASGPKPIG